MLVIIGLKYQSNYRIINYNGFLPEVPIIMTDVSDGHLGIALSAIYINEC